MPAQVRVQVTGGTDGARDQSGTGPAHRRDIAAVSSRHCRSCGHPV